MTVKRITLWRGDHEDRLGALAGVLGPIRAAGADLQVVMAYRESGGLRRAVFEVYPLSGKSTKRSGLAPSTVPTLLVTGDNRRGVGHAMTEALAVAGISLNFLVAQVIGRKYSAVFGFESDADARRAAPLLRRAATRKRA
jgi:hypothetical protein